MPNYPPKPMRGWPNTPLHEQLINDPDWIAEPKKNGHRTMVFIGTKEGPPLFVSRRGSRLSLSELGNIPLEIKKLKVLSVLDGELVMLPTPTLWVFDIPNYPGTFKERRERLIQVISRYKLSSIKLIPWMNKSTAYEEALKFGDEGVVFKNLNSLYIFQMEADNEISDWIKMKPAEKW